MNTKQHLTYPLLAAWAASAVWAVSGCGGTPTTPTPVAAQPTVTTIAPQTGPIEGGTAVTIAGTNFTESAVVTVGGVGLAGAQVVNATTITGTTGAHAAGVVDVLVRIGNQTATLGGGFTYTPPPPVILPPTVTSIAPTSGPTDGGTPVTITGTNFAQGATVLIGAVTAPNVQVLNATTITAVTGAHPAGVASVVVIVGSTSGSLPAGFTYIAPPPNVSSTIQGTSQVAREGEDNRKLRLPRLPAL